MTWLKLPIRKFQTLLQLSAGDRAILLQALGLLPLVAISIRLKGLQFTQAFLLRLPLANRCTPSTVANEELERQVWQTVRMVRIGVGYNSMWTNCLKQSLVLWILLRSQGILSVLRIGVRTESAKFSAHAWVEYEGIVLNDTDDVHLRFQAFDRAFEQPIQEKL
jgi:Transglutaminase-like superfamily